MGVRFACHACGKRLNIKTELAGRRGICPACSVRFRIPRHDTETSTPITSQESDDDSESSDSVYSAERETSSRSATATAARPVASEAVNTAAHAATRKVTSAPTTIQPVPAVSPRTTTPPAAPAPRKTPTLEEILGGAHATWYVRPPSGGQYGPADGPTLGQWIQEGRVSETAMLWRDGWPDWKAAKQVLPIFAGPASSPAPATVEPPESSSAPPAATPAPVKTSARVSTLETDVSETNLNIRAGGKVLDTNKKKMSRKRVALSIMLGCLVVVLAVALVLVLMNPR